MKHNYVKILTLDFDCQIYNNNSKNEIYETLVCYFVLS